MTSQIENVIDNYKLLSKIPSVASGRLNKAGNEVTAVWSVRAIDKGKSAKFIHNYVLDGDLNVVSQSRYGTDVSSEILSAVSPNETYRAVIREEKDKEKKQFLEVWSQGSLAHCVDLTALDLHGDVYTDSEFGSLSWSNDEGSIVYVAERKLKKSEPYVKRKPADKSKVDGSGENVPVKGEEYLYRQDWGEQLVGKHLSVIVVCRLVDESFTVLEGLDDTDCPGQVRFAPDGNSVIGVSWPTQKRLGLIFCTNRPSYIFQLTLGGVVTRLSGADLSVRSPRVRRPGGAVWWLQRGAGGAHHAAHQLVTSTLRNHTPSTIIDIIDKESTIENGSFTGLYSQALPAECFANDGRVVFSTPQRNEVRSYVVNPSTSAIVDISLSRSGSTSVLCLRNDVILAVWSNMTTPGQLYVARLPAAGNEKDIKWIPIGTPTEVPQAVKESTVQYLSLDHKNDDKVGAFTAIFFSPKTDKKLPLIVWPHGGPHSNFVNAFSLEAALFALSGFAMLQINYRGSTGAGQASLEYLPKRVGDADVKDCMFALEHAIKTQNVDETNVLLFGGSHGGFLVTHISGQYPSKVRAVVSRNPVVDVASMINSTDIPDWCAVEAGYVFDESGPVSEEVLLAMRRCSPLAHVHKVRAPTAMMLGSGDKRVPMCQGLEYIRRLRANGVETRVYMYEDNHSLSKIPSEMDNLINSVKWFLDHLH